MELKTKYLIIGNSMAAVSGAEAIRACDREGDCAILTEESAAVYSRPMLAHLVASEMSEGQVVFRPEGFHERLNLDVRPGQKVITLDPDEKVATTEAGLRVFFEKALIAAGSRPRELSIDGIDAGGVYSFQTLDDARRIIEALEGKTRAVIIGAGLIGMRASYALSKKKIKTTLVEMTDRIMPTIMDRTGSDILVKAMEEDGTRVVLNATVEKVLTENGRVTGVATTGGEELPCNLLLVTAGVVPNVGFLEGSGIKVNRGVLVDQYLQTSKEGIYAAGDIVEFIDRVSGLQAVNANWPNAQNQGSVAGANMAGRKQMYDGSIGLNSIECGRVASITMGLVNPPGDDYQVLNHASPENNQYRKLVFAKGRLVGAILIGSVRTAGLLLQLINEKIDVTGLEDHILREGKGFFDLVRGLNRAEMEGDVEWPESLSSQEYYEKKFNDEKWAEREKGRRKW